jgi:hypothetical protein
MDKHGVPISTNTQLANLTVNTQSLYDDIIVPQLIDDAKVQHASAFWNNVVHLNGFPICKAQKVMQLMFSPGWKIGHTINLHNTNYQDYFGKWLIAYIVALDKSTNQTPNGFVATEPTSPVPTLSLTSNLDI